MPSSATEDREMRSDPSDEIDIARNIISEKMTLDLKKIEEVYGNGKLLEVRRHEHLVNWTQRGVCSTICRFCSKCIFIPINR